ncbi:MAG: hypothetical protein LBH14_06730, partial [Desulfobulbaceae bacterium]|nr:hypothetical protein [Desulfobulbaceae bacterium]
MLPPGITGGESGQPLAAMIKGAAGGKAMNHGKEEKTGSEKLFAMNQARPAGSATGPGAFGPAFF